MIVKQGTSTTHSQRIGAFASELDISEIPKDVVEKAKLHLLDMIAAAFTFVRDPLARKLVDIACAGQPQGLAGIIGFSERTSPREAAFVNGSVAHGMDFDDVHVASITHPSVVVWPAVLAIGEEKHLSGATAITSAIVGIEVAARLGLAGGAAMARRGIPPMTACGTLASAAAAGRAYELNAKQIAAAIGVAGSLACGSHEWTIAGTNSKLTTPGWAARSGVIAARMAQDGFDGSLTAIEGPKGLMVSMAGPDCFDPQEPSAEFGERWETRNLAIKRFPSCQGTQPYIWAALELLRDHDFLISDISEIEIVVGNGVGLSLSEPTDAKRNPKDAYAAKFSIPFCVALALSQSTVRIEHFGADWQAARQASMLARRIVHRVDPDFDKGAADRGLVKIVLKDGRQLQAEQRTSNRVATRDQIEEKFAECAGWFWSDRERDEICEAVMNLDAVDNMGDLMMLLTRIPESRD